MGAEEKTTTSQVNLSNKSWPEIVRDHQRNILGLIGIINCAGCPTTNAQNKILRRVRSIAEFGVALSIYPTVLQLYTLLQKSSPG